MSRRLRRMRAEKRKQLALIAKRVAAPEPTSVEPATNPQEKDPKKDKEQPKKASQKASKAAKNKKSE